MVKFFFRWAFRLALVLLVLGVGLLLLKDTLARDLATRRIQAQTGLETRIGKLEVGLLTPTLTVQDFRLYNPAEFGGSPFVTLPELHLQYDPAALRSGRLHLRLVRLHVAEVSIVEDRQGRTNFLVFQQTAQKKGPGTGGFAAGRFQFAGVDTLNLTFGKLRWASLADPARNREIDIGIKNEIVSNIRSEDDLKAALVRVFLARGAAWLLAPPNPTRGPAPVPTNAPAPRIAR